MNSINVVANFISNCIDIILNIFNTSIDFFDTLFSFFTGFLGFLPNDLYVPFTAVLLTVIALFVYKFVR